MMRRMFSLCLLFLLCGGLYAHGSNLGFARYYSNGMVLQRDQNVKVSGFAPPGADVTVAFAGKAVTATANKNGLWSVKLAPMPANAHGQELIVTSPGALAVTLKDVVVGDVFLFARQTSINVALGRDDTGRGAAAKSGDARFRAIRIETVPADEPQDDLAADATSGWTAVNEQAALKMSGAAFYLGRDLARQSDVPIGIVDLNMGHYFPIAWMSREDLRNIKDVLGVDGTRVDHVIDQFTREWHEYKQGKPQQTLAEYQAQAIEKAKQKGQPVPTEPVGPENPLLDPRFPAAGYNAVLQPLRGVAFRGVLLQLGNDYLYVLYQKIIRDGNGLSRRHLGWAWKNNYDLRKWGIYLEPETIPRVVDYWRLYLDNSQLPVGWIMPPASDLPTMADHHREMRELQRTCAERVGNVGLIRPGSDHIPFSAQPADEALIAKRCLAWIRGAVYQEAGMAPSGPLFDHMTATYSNAQIFFKPGTAEGLKADRTALDCFEVAGTDGAYYPAKATIDGTTIRLTSDKVNAIAHVRYNWRRKPDTGLVNETGLPAIPFRTDDHAYPKTIGNTETDLPEEYSTPARDWKGGDVSIINGSLARGNWPNGDGWLGACGVMTAPFGPNMGVLQVLEGSPADGRIMVGDIIYDVNGKLLGDDPLRITADAITYAESEAGNGAISFGLRRNGKNMNVQLTLEVLGTYSSTSPYNCPKTDRIVANMEDFLAARGGVMPGKHCVFQNMDALFMQAAGTPKYLGLVRRHVYDRMSRADITKRIDPMEKPPAQNWVFAYDALLSGEYYLATGDANVLPFLKWNCDYLAVTQNKVEPTATPWPSALAGSAGGWRHNFYGRQGYGMLPSIGGPAMLGFRFAKEAGLDIDQAAYARGLEYFIHNGARVGSVFYGHSAEPITVPEPFDAEAITQGKLNASNGAKATVAILFKLEGDLPTAHICSFMAANAFNNLHKAHGGNFWGNCFSGMGAYVHSRQAFIRFMRGNAWYRDLHRMYNHSYDQGSGGIGGGQFLPYVLPRHRLRMLGAPESVFAGYPKEFFRPALTAHRNRDYAHCIECVDQLTTSRVLDAVDTAKAKQLRRVASELQESIALDLTKVEGLIAEGKLHEASLDLPQLEGVVAPGNPRLAAIQAALTAPDAKQAMAQDKKRYEAYLTSLTFDISAPKADPEDEAAWTCLLPQSDWANRMTEKLGRVPEQEAATWRIKVVESAQQAPEEWMQPTFDDTSWNATVLPISWCLNHTVLLRSSFDVAEKKSIDALRIRMWSFRQQNVQIFINGKLVAKVNKASNNATLKSNLSKGALHALRNGKNTIAVTSLNNWRWGRYMTHYETDASNSVYNNGFTLMLDAHDR